MYIICFDRQLVVWASPVVHSFYCLIVLHQSESVALPSTPALFTMASSTICRGGKGSCECEEFYPSEANDRICKECMHGKSNHPRSLPTNTGPPTNSLPLQSNPPPSATESSSAVNVFHSIVGKQGLLLTGETQRSSEPSVVSLAKVRAEVLGTFSSQRQADNSRLV